MHLKPPELLETPNVEPRAISSQALKRGRFNDHPRGVPPSGGKRGARKRDDMVCSVWRHAAVRKRTGAELASCVEQKVKRAAFKWGIGRELYSAPTIWVKRDMCNRIREGRNGKEQCYDDFRVTEMTVEDGRIVSLQICNMSNKGAVVFGPNQVRTPDDSELQASKKRMWQVLSRWAELHGREPMEVLKGVQKRPEWAETVDFFDSVADEFEGDMAQTEVL